jgi:hypothetical protein
MAGAEEHHAIDEALFESTYVNHRFRLLVIFGLCGHIWGPGDYQLIGEKQTPQTVELLSLLLHHHLLLFETAYFILDFLHLKRFYSNRWRRK